jgi:hypothetical protein
LRLDLLPELFYPNGQAFVHKYTWISLFFLSFHANELRLSALIILGIAHTISKTTAIFPQCCRYRDFAPPPGSLDRHFPLPFVKHQPCKF